MSLLFHGTCALSVAQSYQTGRKLAAMSKAQALKQIRNETRREDFEEFGPLYPCYDHNQPICLEQHLDYAASFACDWEMQSDEGAFSLTLESANSRRFHLFKEGEHFINGIIDAVNCIGKKVKTPGAVLVVDQDYMNDKLLLMRPKGEESHRAWFIPWSAIVGVLFINAGTTNTQLRLRSRPFDSVLVINHALRPDIVLLQRPFLETAAA